jgi:hypothetical protein
MATGAVKQDLSKVVILKKEFMDVLQESVTCSKCKKVPRNATVSWCSAHHLMCQSCYDNRQCGPVWSTVVQCGPDCKVESKPALSPYVANVLKELLTQCMFTYNGCQVFIKMKELEVHEVDCVYRKISCPILNCNDENVSFIGLGEHLAANHKDLTKTGQSKSNDRIPMPVPKQAQLGQWIPHELTFRNRSFFVEVVFESNRNRFWIYFLGTPEEAAHYSYRLKIIGGNGNEIIFKGKVTSLDVMPKLIKKDIFILYHGQVSLLQCDGGINFEINIYSDKEEIKNEDVESGISDDDNEEQ